MKRTQKDLLFLLNFLGIYLLYMYTCSVEGYIGTCYLPCTYYSRDTLRMSRYRVRVPLTLYSIYVFLCLYTLLCSSYAAQHERTPTIPIAIRE